MMEYPNVPVKFNTPSCSVIFGSTSCGKSQLTRQILLNSNEVYDQKVNKILYCYTAHQPLFDTLENELENITFFKGLPSEHFLEEFTSDSSHTVCVLDDMQHAIMGSSEMEQLFTVSSHHKNISVIMLLQNLFAQGKHARSIALQAHYLIAMKSLRDKTQLSCLSRQIYPGKSGLIPEVFEDVSRMSNYPYLIIDLAPHSDDRFRLRTNIFPGDLMTFYQPKP